MANILLIILGIGYIILCVKKKKIFISLPYMINFLILPYYNILDSYYLVEKFGCGCTRGFNANSLREVVFSIIGLISIIIGIFFSKKINIKRNKIIYIVTVILLNIYLVYHFCSLYRWL